MNRDNGSMNCETYRQTVTSSPSDISGELAAHASDCPDCHRYGEGLRAFDATLNRAMAIDVPALRMPALPDADSGGRVYELPRRRMSVPAWFGMAAGFALAAYLGLLMISSSGPELSLADQVIAHLEHEAGSRIVTDVAVPERTLESVVSKDVAELNPGIGLITYARSCVINGKVIPHLVMQGEHGPVTLLLMPDEPVESAVPLHGQNINGVILPLGDGSIAIVGVREEQLQALGERVVDAVKWST